MSASKTQSDLDNKINAIKQLLQLFRFERMLYLIVTILSLLVLIGCALYLLLKGDSQIPAVVGMFGSSGSIAFSCGRLLKMWSDAIRILSPITSKEND